MNWFIILPAVIVFICLILITKVSIKLMVRYTPTDKDMAVQVRMWFIRYTFNVLSLLEQKRNDKAKEGTDTEQSEEQNHSVVDWIEKLPALIKSIGDIHTIGKDFLHKVKVKKFQWRSHLGTGDAASTGIIAGYIWSVKGLIIGFVSSYMQLVKPPSLDVVPVFQGKISATELECIISFRIGRGLLAAYKFFRYFQKNRTMFVDKGITDIRG